jgi:isoleucyl-tRNA synthetase
MNKEVLWMAGQNAFWAPFSALPSRLDLLARDAVIIGWVHRERIFAPSLELTKDSASWTFYEGPPTANGSPGIHHVEAVEPREFVARESLAGLVAASEITVRVTKAPHRQ